MLYSPTKFSILYTVYNKSLYIIANNKEINKKIPKIYVEMELTKSAK